MAKAKLGRFLGTGETKAKARTDLDRKIKRAIGGDFTPRTIYATLGDAGEYLGLCWRTPLEWRFAVIDFSEEGVQDLQFTRTESSEEAFRRVRSSIAQTAYQIAEDGTDNWDTLLAALFDEDQEASYFATWVGSQRARAAHLRAHPRDKKGADKAAAENVPEFMPEVPRGLGKSAED